jgi:multidrug efflux system membrane fusion protein
MKLNRQKMMGVASAVIVIMIGGAFAYHNMHSEETHYEMPTDLDPRFERLNPNGSELVVRAFRIESESSANHASHTFTGTLQPRYQASVGFRVAGKISERKVELGQHVRKGEVLFRLDPVDSDLQLRVSEAEHGSAMSTLKQTKADENRLLRLRPTGSVSQSDFDLALAAREVAVARVDAAERRLALAKNQREYCDLISDSDGLVTAISAEAGQVVNVGQPVLQIMQRNELEAVVSLSENLVDVAKKFKATAVFWSRPDLVLQAELRELSPIADPISRTFDAKFRLLDPAANLAIGMTVSIQLSSSSQGGIAIPLSSIASREELPIVWRILPSGQIANSVEAVPVEIVQYLNDTALVRAPLQAGDQIVNAGVQRVDKNSRVRIWEAR